MMSTTSRKIGLAVLIGSSLMASDALALGRGHRANCGAPCASAPAPCAPCEPAEPKMVERTVMVPEKSTETRTIKTTEYRQEQREKTVTVTQRVPKTESV